MSVINDVVAVLGKLPEPVIDAVSAIVKALASSPEPEKDAKHALVELQAKAAYRSAATAIAKAKRETQK